MKKSSNTVWHHASVTRDRRQQLNGHRGAAIWFTDLSGAAKSTLFHAVEERLHQMKCRTFVLDGDNVRHGLWGNLGFSEDDLSTCEKAEKPERPLGSMRRPSCRLLTRPGIILHHN
jgi:adenylylsulfate kinase